MGQSSGTFWKCHFSPVYPPAKSYSPPSQGSNALVLYLLLQTTPLHPQVAASLCATSDLSWVTWGGFSELQSTSCLPLLSSLSPRPSLHLFVEYPCGAVAPLNQAFSSNIKGSKIKGKEQGLKVFSNLNNSMNHFHPLRLLPQPCTRGVTTQSPQVV